MFTFSVELYSNCEVAVKQLYSYHQFYPMFVITYCDPFCSAMYIQYPVVHCKMRSMKFIQNYHNEHTKFTFGMLIVVILYEFHTSHFAVYEFLQDKIICCIYVTARFKIRGPFQNGLARFKMGQPILKWATG